MYESGLSNIHDLLIEKLNDSLEGEIPQGTQRRIYGVSTFPGKANAIIGMRRAGKTTYLHQLRRDRLDSGTPRVHLPYINFEDERLDTLTAQSLGFLLEEFYRRYPDARRRQLITWCFDEIQLVPDWEQFVRRILDSERVEVFVSGSSAKLLSREIATSLRGRGWETVIYPFSFEETLRHTGIPVPHDPRSISTANRSILEHALLDWLRTGGFPEAQGLDQFNRSQLLNAYVDVAILRDVIERHNVSNTAGLRWLVRHLMQNAGSFFSVERFYQTLRSQGFSIAKDTIYQLVDHLTDCFLVRTIWIEASSERQRMVNPRKAYPIDQGLIPVFDRSGRANLGHALETAVLIELERRRCEVTYVKTKDGFEVDFLARSPDGELDLIQVSADVNQKQTLERELRALEAAGPLFPRARKRLITLTRAFTLRAPKDVIVQSADEWFLTAP